MTNTVFCCKLKKELEALPTAPFPGPLGAKILQNVSKEAWALWLNHQIMLINEYRLNLSDPAARDYLKAELDKYFFSEEA